MNSKIGHETATNILISFSSGIILMGATKTRAPEEIQTTIIVGFRIIRYNYF